MLLDKQSNAKKQDPTMIILGHRYHISTKTQLYDRKQMNVNIFKFEYCTLPRYCTVRLFNDNKDKDDDAENDKEDNEDENKIDCCKHSFFTCIDVKHHNTSDGSKGDRRPVDACTVI